LDRYSNRYEFSKFKLEFNRNGNGKGFLFNPKATGPYPSTAQREQCAAGLVGPANCSAWPGSARPTGHGQPIEAREPRVASARLAHGSEREPGAGVARSAAMRQCAGDPKVFTVSFHEAPRTRPARRAGPTRTERGQQHARWLTGDCGGTPTRGRQRGGREVVLVAPARLGRR
jgi:hypothetical protein